MALYIKNAKDKTAQQGRCKMHIISFFMWSSSMFFKVLAKFF